MGLRELLEEKFMLVPGGDDDGDDGGSQGDEGAGDELPGLSAANAVGCVGVVLGMGTTMAQG